MDQRPSEPQTEESRQRDLKSRESLTGFDAILLGKVRPQFPPWMQILPFTLGAVFFLSSFFTVFSPLPLLVFHLRLVEAKQTLLRFGGAIFSNALIIGLIAGWPSVGVFLASAGVISFSLPYFFLHRKMPVDRSVVMTLFHMALASILGLTLYGAFQGANPLALVKQEIHQSVDQILALSDPQLQSSPLTLEQVKENLVLIFPSMIAIFGLIMVWANLLLLIRFHPVYVQKVLGKDLTFLRTWKAPEFLVWPTIVMGALLIFDIGWPSIVASNIFRFLMAIYAIQGLSVLTALFDTWKIQGFFRTLGYVLAVWPFTPMLLALGFFDLWFDFRAKFRQSS